jgi:hypothetical protein
MNDQGNESTPRPQQEPIFEDLVSTQVTDKAAFATMPRNFKELPRELPDDEPILRVGLNPETSENLIVANIKGMDGKMHWYVGSFGGITYNRVDTEEGFIAFRQKALTLITAVNEVPDAEDNLDVLLADILKVAF